MQKIDGGFKHLARSKKLKEDRSLSGYCRRVGEVVTKSNPLNNFC